MTIEDLTHLDTQRRRKIEACLRAIRQGSSLLVLFACAAEASVNLNHESAWRELESVYRQIQELQNVSNAIARELEN